MKYCQFIIGITITLPVVLSQVHSTPKAPAPPKSASTQSTVTSTRTSTSTTATTPAATTTPEPCDEDEFQCSDGSCIWSVFLCDGEGDCETLNKDGVAEDEDKDLCEAVPCYREERNCPSNRLAGVYPACVPEDWFCDGEIDCLGGEDENDTACGYCQKNEIKCDDTCVEATSLFQCSDGECIPTDVVCDHISDCNNGDDEKNCSTVYRNCTDAEFKCNSGKCINNTRVCDGVWDCMHGTDEKKGCYKPTEVCADIDFTCDNGNCLTKVNEELCNLHDDCGDNSDEQCDNFLINECRNVTHPVCGNNSECINTLLSYYCKCHDGYLLKDDKENCEEINECQTDPLICNQKCSNTKGSYVCACEDTYKLLSDGTTCHRSDAKPEPFLIFANRFYVRQFNLPDDGVKTPNQYSRISSDHTYTHVLDYDYAKQLIYFVDAGKQQINSMKFDGTDINTLNTHYASGVEGIAVDWIGKKLYWTSTRLKGIYVSHIDGSNVMWLVKDKSRLPRGIIVYPQKGYVYWTDWSLTPFIGRIGMDGNVKDFSKIVKSGLFWPNGLTIDYVTERIYWVDAHLDRIESADIEGNGRVVVRTNVPHVYAITVFEEWMYWTEWNVKRVEKANRFTGKNHEVLLETTHLPYDIHVVHPLKQVLTYNHCGIDNGGCSHLCLIKYGGEAYQCACPNNFNIGPDGKTCTGNCSVSQFECAAPDSKCIPYQWYCDGEEDCGTGNDEPNNCPTRTCPPGAFECASSTAADPQCVSSFLRVCNQKNDCADGSDEKSDFCESRVCLPYEFRCKNGQCITQAWKCDEEEDCADGSDEVDEICDPTIGGCTEDEFTCDNGRCIPQLWVCDWDDDCGDMSDEPDKKNGTKYHGHCWKTKKCPEGWQMCRTNYRCIPTTAYCDGEDDCRDNSDEETERCEACDPEGDFTCTDGGCIPKRWVCDGEDDCEDGSDEPVDCVVECSEVEWECPKTKRCIHMDRKCDHRDDCGDNSDEDENLCEDNNCPIEEPPLFHCASGHCIIADKTCNRRKDCLTDGSDEQHCNATAPDWCKPTQFKCGTNVCIDKGWVCDGVDDCGDKSDETVAVCKDKDCKKLHRCTNGKCIRLGNLCDGVDDCGDGSDENDLRLCSVTPTTKCKEAEFLCDNKQCVGPDQVCDNSNDCGDLSDERACGRPGSTCTAAAADPVRKCSQKCTDLKDGGYYCSCNETSYIVSPKDSTLCIDKDECATWGNHCPQICVNEKGKYACSCNRGFEKDLNYSTGYVCNSMRPESTRILVSNSGSEIKQYIESANENSPVVRGGAEIQKIAIDPKVQLVYWVDKQDNSVKRGKIPKADTSLSVPQDLEIKGLVDPEGIAFDWYSDHIYFTDAKEGKIYMARSDGNYLKTLVSAKDLPGGEGMRPSAIAVNPLIGKMFWTDNNPTEGKIWSALLNGFQPKPIIKGLYDPTDITIDYYMNNRLFWSDLTRGTIESANYTGGDKVVVHLQELHRPLSLDVFESKLYFGSSYKHEVYKKDKFGRGVQERIMSGILTPRAIKVFNPLIYPYPGVDRFPENKCGRHSCDGLCVTVAPARAVCVCPDGAKTAGSVICDTSKIKFVDRPIPEDCSCFNGGHCTLDGGQYKCMCREGISGEKCEITPTPVSRPTPQRPSTPSTPPPRSTSETPGKSDKNADAIKIVIPIVLVLIILLVIIVIVIWMIRSGRLGGKMKSSSGRAEYRVGTPGLEANSVCVSNSAYSDPVVMEPVPMDDGGITNPMYDSLQPAKVDVREEPGYESLAGVAITTHDPNHNAEPIPLKKPLEDEA